MGRKRKKTLCRSLFAVDGNKGCKQQRRSNGNFEETRRQQSIRVRVSLKRGKYRSNVGVRRRKEKSSPEKSEAKEGKGQKKPGSHGAKKKGSWQEEPRSHRDGLNGGKKKSNLRKK